LLAALGWNSINSGLGSARDHLDDMLAMRRRMAHEFPIGSVVVASTVSATSPTAATARARGLTGGVLVFQHGLQSRDGVRALVEIEYVTPRSQHGEHLAVMISETGTLSRWSRGHGPDMAFDLGAGVSDGSITRIFAGQPDPNDESHFTINFERNGQRSTWDGWLIDLPMVSRSGCPVGLKMSDQDGVTTVATP
jgi:hypothetical protein